MERSIEAFDFGIKFGDGGLGMFVGKSGDFVLE